MASAKLDFNPSHRERASARDVEFSLRAGRLDPKLLYASDRLAGLWRQVFLKHSPINDNPEFTRIYRDAFRSVAELLSKQTIWLVGLGAGTGAKETMLISDLVAAGCDLTLSLVDVSSDLVLEATESAIANSECQWTLGNVLVTDLADVAFLKKWLGDQEVKTRRLYTFFGLVPNFAPSFVAELFRAILRPGDLLLCSAHLAPVDEQTDLRAAMEKVLPQYDNAETVDWLKAAIEEAGLTQQLSEPVMTIGETEGVPAFLGLAAWKAGTRAEMDRSFEVFRSLRYTPELFEKMLADAGFAFERLALTACREEGIWAVRG